MPTEMTAGSDGIEETVVTTVVVVGAGTGSGAAFGAVSGNRVSMIAVAQSSASAGDAARK
jgi:hypothetical protein